MFYITSGFETIMGIALPIPELQPCLTRYVEIKFRHLDNFYFGREY